MKPAAFAYHRAHDVADAVGLLRSLSEEGEEPKLIAGGQSLTPMMNFRLARPTALVDLGGLRRDPALRAIRVDGDVLTVGALVTHREIELAADRLGPQFAVLAHTMRWVGHLPIRSRGTVAGSLVHGDATAEWCLLALLFDAVVVAEGPGGRRDIPASEMFHGFYTTAVDPDEVVTEVRFTRGRRRAAVTEFARRHGDFATVDVAVALDEAPGGGVAGRVVLGGVAPAPVRVPEAEAALSEAALSEAALFEGALSGEHAEVFAACADAAAGAVDPPSDAAGSGAYRRRLVRTLVTRALAEAWEKGEAR